ncbi:MAG: hypothetical protein Q7Q71_03085 [Verrucomicrobiota bacterium JB023]|nr:hypothetical protein [Verrucomicrobiota bacterium JB023]
MNDVSELFHWVNWVVLFGYLALTTWVGHLMRGKQASINDFFKGGKSLPWQAVCGSIIATEISGVTFIGVPGMVMAANGDFTYMLWGIGSVIGRVIVGLYFVRTFYEGNIYSPYDYMGQRINPRLKTLATVFFSLGSILGQSVRVLVAALPLKVVTGLPFELCIVIIGLFAVGWTLMGGMRTVIWTDVMQFFLFTVGGLLSLYWMISHLDGGFAEYWETASNAGKTQIWDARFGFAPEFEFTFWVALLAVPFQNLTAFGVDQLNAQRMFCCKSPEDAKKAIIWSSVGQLLTLLMLLVGAGLFVFYATHPAEGVVGEALQFNENGVPADGDKVFPVWIISELPIGLSGLILAAVFAAAISSLDSILAALSQTTLSLFHNPDSQEQADQAHQDRLVRKSRILVVIWGIVLTLFTMAMYVAKERMGVPILPLAFGMTAYTMGPLLGMFLVSLRGEGSLKGLVIGSVLSFIFVAFIRMDLWVLLENVGLSLDWLASLPTYEMNDAGQIKPTVGYFWAWPLTTAITFFLGTRVGRH